MSWQTSWSHKYKAGICAVCHRAFPSGVLKPWAGRHWCATCMEELKARKHDMREERDVKSREEVRQTLIARQAQRALPLSGTADAPAVRADDVPIVLSVPGSQPSGQKVWGKGYGVLGRSAPRSDLDRMIAKVRVQR